jgi:hypothetical protein
MQSINMLTKLTTKLPAVRKLVDARGQSLERVMQFRHGLALRPDLRVDVRTVGSEIFSEM